MTIRITAAGFEEPLLCAGCGSHGSAFWEGSEIVTTSDAFYLRVKLPLSLRPDLVCHGCGAVQQRNGQQAHCL